MVQLRINVSLTTLRSLRDIKHLKLIRFDQKIIVCT